MEEEQKEETAPEPFAEEFSENATEESVPVEEIIEAAPEEENPKKRKKKREVELGKFNDKKPWQRIIVLVSGALMNYILAVFLIIICFFAYGQTMTAVYRAAPIEGIST